MSDEFKVGDVVVCVLEGASIRKGEIHRIVGFCVGPVTSGLGISHLGIFLKNKQSCGRFGSYDARRFKHLPKADDIFINQMRSLKPAKEKTRV